MKSIEAFVLAGGRSSRMGVDKGLIPLKGKPMIHYVLKQLGEMNFPVTIIANKPGYEAFGLRVLKDEVREKGPMGGLFTALQNSTADLVLLVSCDMPLITTEAVRQLIGEATGEAIIVASEENNIHPLFALYPTNLKEKVRELLDREELKMTDFILGSKHCLVPSIGKNMPWALQNINDKFDLKEVEKKWGHLL